ncbi:unnamed protein product [Cuscuta europaea]|uniref:Solute carrier family 40 protein n=1 Tax=Cuscuta europaea TaxID=41803 RepID=A0A9P0Z549_CUSEU|nr:unnamed protein product [Cuscuta europaea]
MALKLVYLPFHTAKRPTASQSKLVQFSCSKSSSFVQIFPKHAKDSGRRRSSLACVKSEDDNVSDAVNQWGKVSAVLFDMDGALCNSEELSRRAAVDVFAEMGVQATVEDFAPFTGMDSGEVNFLGGVANVKAVKGFNPDASKRFFKKYSDKYAKSNSGIDFPGAFELVAQCKSKGLKVAVASSADRVKVDANLTAAGLSLTMFDAIVSADAFENLKSAPDIFLAASKILNVPPSECVVIEDALAGIQAARAAKMGCIAVTTTLAEATFEAASPTLIRKEIGNIPTDDILNGGSGSNEMKMQACQPISYYGPSSTEPNNKGITSMQDKYPFIDPIFWFGGVANFKSRCSITNIGILSDSTDEEVKEKFESADCNCPVPVVNIKSDILESEALNLLAEGTYVDTLLTTLPVLSKEEQHTIASTPAHPAGLYALYASCLAGNLVEQLWNFAWPATIALLHPSLLSVATMGFVAKVAVIVGGPVVGKLMDHFPRVPAFNCLTLVQAVAQLLSVSVIIHAHSFHATSSSFIIFRPWFAVLVLAGAVERLSGLALGVAVERDWVVLLAGTSRPVALAQANAILNRIDVSCEVAGAALFGYFLSKYEPVKCLRLTATLMIGTLPIVILSTWLTNKLSSGVLDRAKSVQTCCTCHSSDSLLESETIVGMSIEAIKHGWVEYIQQPVLPASIASVLLYFNVVLAPGGLMTAFLTQRGLNPTIIGSFSALSAFMGIAATFGSAQMVKRFGILKAGAASLILQASLLSSAVVVYLTISLTRQTQLMFFLGLIVLSRLGHMSYDTIGSQILQTGIPASKANLIGTTEISFASLAESIMLGVAIIANDVSHFGFLATLSVLSVVSAAWLYCRWLANPTDTQKSLFTFDPQFL